MGYDIISHNKRKDNMIDKLNIGQKFIITYRPNTHNGEARPKLKNGKDTRQITRRAQWNEKCRVVKDLAGKIRYITCLLYTSPSPRD